MKDCDNYISYRDIISHIDIKGGDIVNVSSDILKLICVCRENDEAFDANIFIDAIIRKIGNSGTLLFPTYNWGFCKGGVFDYRNTLSQVGALSNAALKREDFKRTRHPIYSFAVWGHDRDYLCDLNNISAFGADSPFAYLYHRGAKNLFIGLDYKDGLAFVHYAEETAGVDYRYFKDFRGPYIDKTGIKKDLTFRMYVRNPRLCAETVISPQLDDILLNKGYYSRYTINGIYFVLIDLRGIGYIIEHDIRIKGGLIYSNATKDVQYSRSE